MKISVKAISAKGFEFTKSVTPASIGLLDEDIHADKPIEIFAHVERIVNCVSASVQVKIHSNLICDRCLEKFEDERIENYKFNYVVEPNTEFVDLGEDIRQEVIMHLPVRSFCREDCKGICPDCGINLNKEECKCKTKPRLMKRSEHKSAG